jgi:type I restriction enzyme S subunit
MSSEGAGAVTGEQNQPSGLVPTLRFPEFQGTNGWTDMPLRKTCKPINEKVGSVNLTPVSITAGIGFVSQASKFGRDISGEQYKNYTHLRAGDFAYNKGNSKKFPQGYVCQLKEFSEAAASSAFICFRLRDGHEPAFFQAVFDQNIHGRQLSKYITSGARSNGLLNIRPNDFYSINIPIPPESAEQQKIADCLSSIDALIAAEAGRLDAMKDHKKGLMKQLVPAPGETTPRLRFPQFRDAGDWIVRPLGEIATYENGKAHEQHIVEDGQFVVVNARFISTEGAVRKYTNMPLTMAKTDDILMVLSDLPKGKALAKCYFVEDDNVYSVNQRVCRIVAKKISAQFLFNCLNRNEFLLEFDDGMNQTHLKKDNVLDCPILHPKDVAEQNRISQFLSSIDTLVAAQIIRIDALKAHKKGLILQLFPVADEVQG